MLETIEGIVIKNSDYQEKSKILQVFSKEHGLIGILLKGANNYKNNNFALIQPISHAFFNINYYNGLSKCYNGELINSFHSLKNDFSKNIYIFHIFELIYKNLEQHQKNSYLFDILLKIIEIMEKSTDIIQIKLLTIYFELKLLYFIGVFPEISKCVECGSSKHITNFDISKGGFVCEKCIDPRSKIFSVDSLQVLYQLFYQELDNFNYDINDKIISELQLLLREYYNYHLGIKTNSSKYF